MSKHRIAVIAGDGIGQEVMPEGLRVLDAAARRFGIDLHFDHFDFANCAYFARHGSMMPADWKDRIGGHEVKTHQPDAGGAIIPGERRGRQRAGGREKSAQPPPGRPQRPSHSAPMGCTGRSHSSSVTSAHRRSAPTDGAFMASDVVDGSM